jgi:hypothetical protein
MQGVKSVAPLVPAVLMKAVMDPDRQIHNQNERRRPQPLSVADIFPLLGRIAPTPENCATSQHEPC